MVLNGKCVTVVATEGYSNHLSLADCQGLRGRFPVNKLNPNLLFCIQPLIPKLICHFGPRFGIRFAFIAEMLYIFR